MEPTAPEKMSELDRLRSRIAALECELKSREAERLRFEMTSETALRTSEERFRLVSLATRDAFYDWDLTTDVVWRNRTYKEVYGVPEHLPASEQWWEQHVHPDDRERLLTVLNERLAGDDRHWSDEYRIRRHDGEWSHVIDRALIQRDENGKAVRIIGAMTDISARVRAERHRQLMANELDHRVKNNLAAVLALADQTRRAATSVEHFTQTFDGRIRALARAHEALAATRWRGVDLHDVVRIATQPYVLDRDRVICSGESLPLPSRASGPLTLAVHELTTNAVKYGALSTPSGRIEFTSSRGEDDTLRLEWRETGGPTPAGPLRNGVGTSLVRGFIEHELHGTIDMDLTPDGLLCRMTIPIGSLDAPDGAEDPAPHGP